MLQLHMNVFKGNLLLFYSTIKQFLKIYSSRNQQGIISKDEYYQSNK
jgi:hypothetical protein